MRISDWSSGVCSAELFSALRLYGGSRRALRIALCGAAFHGDDAGLERALAARRTRGLCAGIRPDGVRVMSFNSFGRVFRFTTWGESHAPALGAVVDGCPPRLALSDRKRVG